MDPLLDALALALGCTPERAEMALATLAADVHARCRTYGEAVYEGLGTFRTGPDGLTFEPGLALAIVVNHRFAGQGALPATEAPAWDPAPVWASLPPSNTPLTEPPVEAPLFLPWQALGTDDPAPAAPPPAPGLPNGDLPFLPPGAQAPPAPGAPPHAAAPPQPADPAGPPPAVPPAVPPPARPPASAAPMPTPLVPIGGAPSGAVQKPRGWAVPVALLLFAAVLSAAAYLWWARGEAPPAAPALLASPPRTAPPDPALRGTAQSTSPPASTPPLPVLTPPPPGATSTDGSAAAERLDALPAPAPARAAPERPPARAVPASPAPARAAARPPVPEAGSSEVAALRGQEPVEAGRGGWTIVIGGRATEEDAEGQARPLRLRGYRTGVLAGIAADSTAIYRVGVGHFATRAAALAALEKGRGDLLPADAWVLRLR